MAQHFDVAVVGMQTSGIIAAALLAKRGRRVLLVDHGENTTTYRRQGLSLPLLPNLVPSLEQAPHVQRVHDELGLGPELRALSKALDPSFQAVLPKHRLDIRSNREALLEELRLEFPDLVQPAEAFFTRLFAVDDALSAFLAGDPPLPPNSWFEGVKHRSQLAKAAPFNVPFEEGQLLEGIPAGHPVREILLGPLAFFGHLWGEAPSTFHAVRLIARYYRGVTALEDGAGGLARLLLQAAERAGVTVRRGAVVREVGGKGRRIHEIVIEDERLSHAAEYFIANTTGPFYELLPAERRHPRFVAEEQAVSATGSLMVLNL
ncbi:MAG TPA: NAD(P)-binding protein, partial [Myxococcota bacterium]|nr:NAD(P)-binding protein [Myxococcota bacterium]